jgi:hypothetical protein
VCWGWQVTRTTEVVGIDVSNKAAIVARWFDVAVSSCWVGGGHLVAFSRLRALVVGNDYPRLRTMTPPTTTMDAASLEMQRNHEATMKHDSVIIDSE